MNGVIGPGRRPQLRSVKLTLKALYFLVGGMELARTEHKPDDNMVSFYLKWSKDNAAQFILKKDFEDLDKKELANLRKAIQRVSDLVTFLTDTNDSNPVKLLTEADKNGDRSTTIRFRFSQTKKSG